MFKSALPKALELHLREGVRAHLKIKLIFNDPCALGISIS